MRSRSRGAPSLAAALVVVCWLQVGCDDDGGSGPCSGVTCSGRGSCVARGSAAYCVCESGHHPVGLACEPNDPGDPCLGVECGGHGACVVEDDLPRCDCDPGFVPDSSGLLCLGGDLCVPTAPGSGEELAGTRGAEPRVLDLAWSGSTLGVAWIEWGTHFHAFRVVDPAGATVGDEVELGWPAVSSRVAWNGEEWAVIILWGPSDSIERDIVLRRFDRDGSPLGETVLENDSNVGTPQLVWTGEHFLAAWGLRIGGVMQVFAQAVDRAGTPLGEEPARLTSCLENCGPVHIVWTGSSAVLAYFEGSQGRNGLQMLVLDDTARIVAEPIRLSEDADSAGVSLALTRGHLGVVFREHPIPGSDTTRVEVRTLDLESGAVVGQAAFPDTVNGALAAANGVFVLPLFEADEWRLVMFDGAVESAGDDVPIEAEGATASPRLVLADGWWGLISPQLVDETTHALVFERLDCAAAE